MIIGKSLTALGGGGLKPEICVTAKAGALLNLHYKDSTIILQSYQLGAEETQHTFAVDVSETAYLVEDVTNNASVEVLVDAVAKYSVEISYILWLYKDGDECVDITGGWNLLSGIGLGSWHPYGAPAFQKLSDRMTLSYASSNSNVCAFCNPVSDIDLSGYTSINFLISFESTRTEPGVDFSILNRSVSYYRTDAKQNINFDYGETGTLSNYTVSLNFSDYGVYDVGFGLYQTLNGGTSILTIHRVWLE